MVEIKDRISKAQSLMVDKGFDLLAVCPSSNMFYLSDFTDEPGERLLMLLVPKVGDAIFLVPKLYADQVRESSSVNDIRAWNDSDDPRSLLKSTLNELGIEDGRVAIDDTMWASFVLMLQESTPGSEFHSASKVMVPLRRIKSSEEIRNMEKAGAIADRAFEKVSELSLEGRTELEVARALEEAMIKGGADKIGFETLVASGPNAALPHHRASKRKIKNGDTVIFDYGCKVNGYCSDTSRTIICGRPSSKQKEVYKVVKEAQEKAFQAVRPGIEAQKIDRTAREHITQAGYGDLFLHRTGHGIGLDVHEAPYIMEGNSLKLEPGMVFSIEPGIYLQGEFGVRIEDIVVITEDGGKRLNNSTHHLQLTT